jgi:predicted dehydrogenase
MSIRIGIIGFGVMGRTHLGAYAADPRAEVVAVADPDSSRLTDERVAGNLKGMGSAAFDPTRLTRHDRYESLLADATIDAVSICSPTPDHMPMALAAIAAGKHVLVEKPLALTTSDADRVVAAASTCPKQLVLPAMCMRFWPAWKWLRDTVASSALGPVRSAVFTRLGSMPTWSPFYADASKSGGAILDLHIHDVDFVRACFGDPQFVSARGYAKTTAGVDHVVASYIFADGPSIVCAEGGWCMTPGFKFMMRYIVNFERATAFFDFHSDPQLTIVADGAARPIALAVGDGYLHEIRHFLDLIERGGASDVVSIADGAAAVRLVECERRSIEDQRPVAFHARENAVRG